MLASISAELSVLTFFFFNDTATTEIYTLSLHDALPISGSARARLPVHLDGAGGELPARQSEPGRHDQAPAGVRKGRRRRPDGARPARPDRRARGLQSGVEAGELHGGDQREVVHGRRARGGWRQADQPRHLALSRGDDRPARRRARGEGQGDVWLPRPRGEHAGSERLHAGVTALALRHVPNLTGSAWARTR